MLLLAKDEHRYYPSFGFAAAKCRVLHVAKVTCAVPDSEPLEDSEKLAKKGENKFARLLASADTHDGGCVQTNNAHDSESGVFVGLRFEFLRVCDFWQVM